MRISITLALSAVLLGTAVSAVIPQAVMAKQPTCPDTWTGNNCAYFRDGYKQGKIDRRANMSMAYQRHSDMYDSRFEENFRVGYEAGWKGESY